MSASRLLLTTCASLCMMLPTIAVAQTGPTSSGQGRGPNAGQSQDQGASGQHQHREGGQGQGSQGQGRGQGHDGQGQRGSAGGPAINLRRGPPRRHPPTQSGSVTGGAGRGAGQGLGAGGSTGRTPTRRTMPHRPVTPGTASTVIPSTPPTLQVHRPRRPPPGQERGRPPLGDWNRNLHGRDRDQAGGQWRRQHHDWDRASPWRSDPNWWRHNRSFRFYFGQRIGFFFIPDYGYVVVPPEYQQHYWRAGDSLPQWFWRYEVKDYWTYGLPEPPDGCAWVWVDDDVALIDLDDGYILDIVHNVW